MTRYRWIAVTAVVTVLASASYVLAQGAGGRRGGGGPAFEQGPGAPGRGGGRGFGFGGVGARDLDLSDAQRQQMQAITTRAREVSRPQVERLRQATDARRKALSTMPVDENQIRATTQALTTAQTDLAIARARVQADIFAVLTPDQQAKVKQAQERRETRMAERRSRVEERRQQRQQRQNN
jgi:protein CpxP